MYVNNICNNVCILFTFIVSIYLDNSLFIHLSLVSLFTLQGFLEANLKCFWNSSLVEAVRVLEFQGYVAPGVLLVRANPCALEVVRAAWARNVLKPPANYSISVVGKLYFIFYLTNFELLLLNILKDSEG